MAGRGERSRDTHRRRATPRGISTSLDANGSGGGGRNRSPPLSPQYLRHRLPLGEFVDQLVEIAQLAHQRLFDSLDRSEEHTSELQSLMRISYAVFCLKKKNNNQKQVHTPYHNIHINTKPT